MRQQQYGMGMAELLIGLLLSSFTMMLLMNHYVHVKKHYHHIQDNLEKNMDLLLIADLMRGSIRKAGFTPCSVIDQLTSREDEGGSQGLQGVMISSNSIQLTRMSERFNLVMKIKGSSQLYATPNELLKNNQTVVIADCYHAEVKKVSSVTVAGKFQLLRFVQPLSYQYHKPIYLGAWVNERFYIRASPSNRSSLFYKLQHAEELMTGVQTLVAHRNEIQGSTVISISLGLKQSPPLNFSTMVRAH